ncbi:putative gibberellin 2-beta-dioxygenase [Medicago truncatula]|uniref:Putative gibberellin 2-beta-dioxygenase n=1 Tax=Medicago truncatula TaxID=3880 RepID=A0A396IMW6_MEDTR|nr:putative gibberellin 2-beta-dioxygenase [Medicago truncatula]
MVLASPKPMRNETILPNDLIPIVDLKSERSEVIKQIVKASEEYGFFKVINHGISDGTIEKMEEAGFSFFAKPMSQKKQAAPAYGCKNIGFNGDIGEVEYLLLNANTSSIAQISKTISNDDPHSNFRNVMKTTSLLVLY